MTSKYLLFTALMPDAHDEADFNLWYNREHMPTRLGLSDGKGLSWCARYVNLGFGARYFNLYGVNEPAAFENDEYGAIRTFEEDLENNRRFAAQYRGSNVQHFRRVMAELTTERIWRAADADATFIVVEIVTAKEAGQPAMNAWLTAAAAGVGPKPYQVSMRVYNDIEKPGRALVVSEYANAANQDWAGYYEGGLRLLPADVIANVVVETLFGSRILRVDNGDNNA